VERRVRYHGGLEDHSQWCLKPIPIISDPVGYDIVKDILPDISPRPPLQEFVLPDIQNLVYTRNALKDVVGLED